MAKWNFTLAFVLMALFASANVRLPKLTGSNMVLQRNKPVNIWGWADKGEQVSVSFLGKTYNTTTTDSIWKIVLPAMKEGGPYDMTIKGRNEIKLKNILIGDVWLCSGQSNMGYVLKNTSNANEELPEANYPMIRLFTIKKHYSAKPLYQAAKTTKWEACTPKTAGDFSAVAYFFGRKLHTDLNVPIGLIFAAYGGTTIESWTSKEGLAGEPTFGSKAAAIEQFDFDAEDKKNIQRYNEWIKTVNAKDAGVQNGTYVWAASYNDTWNEVKLPAFWDESQELKAVKDGVIWFQRKITLNADQTLNDAILNLGAVSDEDVTFFNGKEIGHTIDNKSLKRKYTVPRSLLKEGENYITVRITNYRDKGGMYANDAELFLQTVSGKVALAGTWTFKVGLDTVVPTGVSKQLNTRQIPCILFNAMIAPVVNTTIKGVLWYQGESNAERAYQYRDLFTRMIKDWRNHFNDEQLPFVYVQLPNYKKVATQPKDSEWAELREAQAMALKLPNTAMVCAIDQGEADDIHPKYKNEVGRRAALQAEYMVYGLKDSAASGPVFKSSKNTGDKILIEFNTSGLKTSDNGKEVKGFAIAGKNGKFYWASAEIINATTVAVYSSLVKEPVAVRYAWSDNPGTLNLTDQSGLPAYPFRTDSFKGKTDDITYVK